MALLGKSGVEGVIAERQEALLSLKRNISRLCSQIILILTINGIPPINLFGLDDAKNG